MRWLTGTAFSIVLALAGCDLIWPSVRVQIHNSTGSDMLDTRLTIRGQEVFVGQVPSSASRIGVLRPKAESGMTLLFKDGHGRDCQQKVDLYMENRYRGDVELFVLDCQSAKLKGFATR